MRPRHAFGTLLALPLLLAPGLAPVLAQADTLEVVNDLRDGGCGRAPPAAPLTRNARLDQAAETFSGGTALGDALERGGYVAVQAAGIQIESRYLDDDAVFEMLSERFCSRLTDPQLRDAGFVQREDRLWLVVAEPSEASTAPPRLEAPARPSAPSTPAKPLAPAVPRSPETVDDFDGDEPRGVFNSRAVDDGGDDVIALVNDARARARRCGSQQYAAAPPLRHAAQLSDAARAHAEDMAARGYFDHKTPEGTTPTQRLARTGYQWNLTGENIARGQMRAEEAVAGWLASPGHCANIMEPRFSETGFALAEQGGRDGALYWVQTFAAPR